MRILHVTETAKGGVGTYLNELIPAQIAAEVVSDVVVIAPKQHAEQLTAIPWLALRLFPRYRRSLSSIIGLLWTVINVYWSYRPDIVHAHSSFAGVIVRLLRPFFPAVKLIFCPHGWSFLSARSNLTASILKYLERVMCSLADQIICVSQSEKTEAVAAGLPKSKLTVVRNGIAVHYNPGRQPSWQTSRLKVLFVGRLDRQKGYDTLLEIAKMVPSANFKVIGTSVVGEERPDLTNPPSNVDILGWLELDEVQSYMDICDLVIIPSRWEGLPLVALEAMRSQKPVLASLVGGLPEAVSNFETGILVEGGIASDFARIINETPLQRWQAMGMRGRARFESEFTMSNLNDQILSVYEHALSSKTRGRVVGKIRQSRARPGRS